MRVGIIDYGAGNIAGLSHALGDAGANVVVVCSVEEEVTDALVLPGVGHFAWCARELEARGWWWTVQHWAGRGGPLLGICVGYQLLYEESEEGPAVGLGILTGKVKKLERPHVGWDEVEGQHYYFCHHYSPPTWITRQGNVTGVQFHPEKSGSAGIAFLREWVRDTERSQGAHDTGRWQR